MNSKLADYTSYALYLRFSYSFIYQGSSKAINLQERVFEHLNIVEKDYFGLRFVDQSDQTVSPSSFKITDTSIMKLKSSEKKLMEYKGCNNVHCWPSFIV